MSWMYRLFRRSKDEGTVTLTGDLAATGGVAGSTVSDESGNLARRYIYQSAEIDVDGSAGATTVAVYMPVKATLLRAYYIVTEATVAATAGAKIQIGVADADGTTGADVDAYVTGAAAATGLIAGKKDVGTVQSLTIAAANTVAAGKCLTVTHVQETGSGTAGKVVVVIEYLM